MQALSNKSKQILANAKAAKGTSKVSSSRLGAATITAQKALSEKFGIATFDTKGKISTVPSVQRGFSDIDVGLGSFKDFNTFATAAVNKQIYDETKKRKDTGVATIPSGDGGFINVTAHEDTPLYVSDPREPTNYYNPETKAFQDTLYNPNATTGSSNQDKFIQTIKDNKWIIIGGIAALIFVPMLLKRGRR